MAEHQTIRRKNRKKQRRGGYAPLIVVLLGVLLLLYPVVGTLLSDYELNKIAADYDKQTESIKPPTAAEKLIHKAREYNRKLAEKGRHPQVDTPNNPDFREYLTQLNMPLLGTVMAQIRIPSIKVNLPIYHTVKPAVLYHGAGHMYGTDLPVGGKGTNAVISAHSGMVDATMFDNLEQVKIGDEVIINVFGETLVYHVKNKKIVSPTDDKAIKFPPDKDLLTLITCTPYGLNTDRLLVTAERVLPLPKDTKEKLKTSDFNWNIAWWMWIDLTIIILTIAFLWWLLIGKQRKKQKQT